MSNVTSISTEDGNVTIDSELFQGYLNEAYEHLSTINDANGQLKLIYEAVAEKTKLKKTTVGKYLKARHAAKTAEAKALGELFAQLDEATGLV